MNNISVLRAMNNISALRAEAAQPSTAVADCAPQAHASPASTSAGLMQLVAMVALHEVASRGAGGIKGDRADMKTGVANITKKALIAGS